MLNGVTDRQFRYMGACNFLFHYIELFKQEKNTRPLAFRMIYMNLFWKYYMKAISKRDLDDSQVNICQ